MTSSFGLRAIMFRTQSYSDERWEEQKQVIHRLYIEQDKTLHALRQDLASNHDFQPSGNKLKTMLKRWKFTKYSNSATWKALDATLKRKGVDINSTEIVLDGRLLPVKKLKKELQRYGDSMEEDNIPEAPPLPDLNLKLQPLVPETPQKPTYAHSPLFELLDLLLPMILPDQNDDTIRSTTNNKAQLLALYARIRTYLIDISCMFNNRKHKAICSAELDESLQLLHECLLDASKYVFTKGQDLSQLVEAYFPSFDETPLPTWDDDLEVTKQAELEDAAIIFGIVYLQLNGLLRTSFDKFVVWAWKTNTKVKYINQMIFRDCYAMRCLKSAILHSAIRLNYSVLAVSLLEINSAQLGHILVDDATAPSYKWGSPLQAALMLGNDELARVLVGIGADVNATHPCDTQGNHGSFLFHRPTNIAARSRATVNLIPLLVHQYNAKFDAADMLMHALLANPGQSQSDNLVQLCLRLVNPTELNDVTMAMLCAACVNGDSYLAEQALRLGASPDSEVPHATLKQIARDGLPNEIFQSCSPLFIAVKHDQMSVVRVLLNYGASQWGTARIAQAVGDSTCNMVELLLNYIAPMGASEIGSLCEIAIARSDLAILELLLLRAGNLSQANSNALSQNLVIAAAELGKKGMLQALLGISWPTGLLVVQSQIEMVRKGLLAAINYNQVDVIQLLMEHGSEVGALDGDTMQTLMDVAMKKRVWKVAVFLFNKGAKISGIEDRYSFQRLLGYAARTCDTTVVKMIIKCAPHGCQLDPMLVKHLLLSVAVASDQFGTAKALIEAGACPNQQDHTSEQEDKVGNEYKTLLPIFGAIKNCNFDMLELLISSGAKLDVIGEVDTDGPNFLNPLELAVFCGFISGASLLLDQPDCPTIRNRVAEVIWSDIAWDEIMPSSVVGGWFLRLPGVIQNLRLEPVLTWCLLKEEWPLFEFALREGVDVNILDDGEGSPLILAISKRKFTYARKLVEMGAIVDARPDSETGITALMEACQQGHIPTIELLLRHSADVNLSIPEDWASTALDIAIERGFLTVVDILLRAGADIRDSKPDKSKGNIAMAAEEGRLDILSLLLDNYKGSITSTELLAEAKAIATQYHQVAVLEFLQKREQLIASEYQSLNAAPTYSA